MTKNYEVKCVNNRGKDWFECKIRCEKVQPNGLLKLVTEVYLVGAANCSEAEDRVIEEISPYVGGDLTVVAVKQVKYRDIFVTTEVEAEYWYKSKVLLITLDEKSGEEKETAVQLLVQGKDLQNALNNINAGLAGTLSDYVVVGVTRTQVLECYESKK